jgi:hypothetical protein
MSRRNVYDGRLGNTYDVVSGFGSEGRDNWRGNSSNNDMFMSFTFKMTYILGKTLHRPKFR